MRAILALFIGLVAGVGLLRVSGLDRWIGADGAARLLTGIIVVAAVACAAARCRRAWCSRSHADVARVKAKCFALACCWLSLLTYAVLMARTGVGQSFPFVRDFFVLLPLMLLAMPFYVAWADRRIAEPEDGYAIFGRALLRQRAWRWQEHKPFVLAWAVKVFFIPIMYSGLQMVLSELLMYSWAWNPASMVRGLFYVGLAFDLLIATLGYLLATTLLRTSILSTDDSWLGWLVCVICYPPLLFIFRMVREQSDDVLWNDWLSADQFLYWVWLALIVLTWAAYWFSNACFGLRFSNLTWRGLISVGPYAYLKHPSYLFKNIYWWLHTVPLVGVAFGADMLRNVLALTFVSGVYYLRAKTEEAHLLRFKEYRDYHAHIEAHGLFARIAGIGRRLRIARES